MDKNERYIEEQKIKAERYKNFFGFLKVFFGVGFVGLAGHFINAGIQHQQLDLERQTKEMEFITTFSKDALAEKPEKRRDLAEYFSKVIPTPEARARWQDYYEVAKKRVEEKNDAEIEAIRAERAEKNALPEAEAAAAKAQAAAEAEARAVEKAQLEADVVAAKAQAAAEAEARALEKAELEKAVAEAIAQAEAQALEKAKLDAEIAATRAEAAAQAEAQALEKAKLDAAAVAGQAALESAKEEAAVAMQERDEKETELETLILTSKRSKLELEGLRAETTEVVSMKQLKDLAKKELANILSEIDKRGETDREVIILSLAGVVAIYPGIITDLDFVMALRKYNIDLKEITEMVFTEGKLPYTIVAPGIADII